MTDKNSSEKSQEADYLKKYRKYLPYEMSLLEKHFSNMSTTLNKMRTLPEKKDKEPFKILVSCLLSLRARDENTEKVSRDLFEVADSPQEILDLPDEKLKKLIFSSGHYNKKAKTLKEVSKEIIDTYNGKVPATREELESIKGVGPKTANIVLSFAFNKQVLPIDTHCHRIPNRLGWIKTKNPEESEKVLEEVLPKKYWQEFNGIMVEFGRTICQPVSPLCSNCPVSKYCPKIGVKRKR